MSAVAGYLVWAALADARARCATVEATERGEANSRRGTREFYYPTPEAVSRAAKAALRAEKLMLVLAVVGAVARGVEGDEVPLTFRLFHAESGEAIDFTWAWPLEDAKDFVGRHAARAATLSSAEKHFQIHLLAMEITGRDGAAAGPAHCRPWSHEPCGTAAAKAAGALPGWAQVDTPQGTTQGRPHHPGPPPRAREDFNSWVQAEFRRQFKSNPNADAASWDELVAMVLGGEPREAATLGEEEQVCTYLATYCEAMRRAS